MIMVRCKASLLAGSVLALLYLTAAVRADIDWSYTTQVTAGPPPFVAPSGGQPVGQTFINPDNVGGGGGISLVSYSTPIQQSLTNTSYDIITLSNLYTVPGGPNVNATFNNHPDYTIHFALTYNGQTQTYDFGGEFGGSYLYNRSSLQHSFLPQTTSSGTTTGGTEQTFTFGSGSNAVTFKVDLLNMVPPGSPSAQQTSPSGAAGAIVAQVTLTAPNNGGPTGGGPTPPGSNTPEPSTMLLAGMGLSLAGVATWRKRRKLEQ